ncbi:MAG TPA: hypothetical protein VNW52_08235, partial [Burkholderiaceae bacterium]|nr:hypothetical protein [Burkholderiaceae bacterium]
RPLKTAGLEYFKVICVNNRNCTARGNFSDGAGSFVAEWQIRAGISGRTIITDSEDNFADFTTAQKNEDAR